MEVADLEYFEDLVRGVEKNLGSLDEALSEFLDRDIAQVDPIERAVLRIAAYELRHRVDVPYRVVINEAIETTKRFGSEHGHTFVNGVLAALAETERPGEVEVVVGRAVGALDTRPRHEGRRVPAELHQVAVVRLAELVPEGLAQLEHLAGSRA